MKEHELEIEILKDGSVKVHVKGAKGEGCLQYAKMLEEIVGKIGSQQPRPMNTMSKARR